MTTIIFVILGILLAAAAALMVVFYGGDAFNAGAVKADANTVIGKVQQVAFAVQLRQASTGERLSATTYATNLQLLKNEGWLSRDLDGQIVTVDADGYGSHDVDHVYMVLGQSEDDGRVCRQIDMQAGSTNTAERIESPADWKGAVARRPTYGCFQYYTGIYVAVSHV
jgi:hypothetical protein